mmetsp:Transcript_46296/g.119759  ORF Transcript_46296/g.119759 Transcript_46296/m.119759 type:complete len:270 (-) Transcript_46296:355-1164(-)
MTRSVASGLVSLVMSLLDLLSFPFLLLRFPGAVMQHEEGLDQRQQAVQERLRGHGLRAGRQGGACGRRETSGALHAHLRRRDSRGEQTLRGCGHDLGVTQALERAVQRRPECLHPGLLEEVLDVEVLLGHAFHGLLEDLPQRPDDPQEARLHGRGLRRGRLALREGGLDVSDQDGQDLHELCPHHLQVVLRRGERNEDLCRHLVGVPLAAGAVAAASLAQEVAEGQDALAREDRVHVLRDLGPPLQALLHRRGLRLLVVLGVLGATGGR